MRPNDPNPDTATILGTEQLRELLNSHFARASEPEMDFQSKLLRWKTGFYDNENPFASVHQEDEDSDKNVARRIRLQSDRMAGIQMRAEVFSHQGYSLTFTDFLKSLDTADNDLGAKKEDLEEDIQQAKKEAAVSEEDLARTPQGRVFRDDADLERWIQHHGTDGLQGDLSLTMESIVVIDNRMMDAAVLEEVAKMEEELAQVEEQHQQVEEYQAQTDEIAAKIESGEITAQEGEAQVQTLVETMPEEVKTLVVEAHVENEQQLSTEEPVMATAPVDVPAQLQDVVNVVATFAPSPDPKP